MSTNGTTKPIRIGVLHEAVQMSDLVGVDILGTLTPKYLSIVKTMMPNLPVGPSDGTPFEFLYIASTLEPAWCTPEMFVKPTHTYESAPRDLDVIFIGGPDPSAVPEASLTFLREAAPHTKHILTTCSGGMWLARSGVLDGRKATTNRGLLAAAAKWFPKVEWLDQKWVVEDGMFEGAQIWTGGGAGAGIEMTIEYAAEKYNPLIVKMGAEGMDFEFEGRSQFYKGPLTGFSAEMSSTIGN